ncbi:sensor histidine kinase [Hydrogenophaga sp.]|uniref:sensor histidine kinase n=1 Tax=Hydrogenophaga sp. TaxID=1904254 RepID=UPI003D1399FF
MSIAGNDLKLLAQRLSERRENILRAWREAVSADAALTDRVDVALLLRELWETVDGQARHKGLAFSLNGPQPFVVQIDAVKLRRIAQNLVFNAVRYTRAGGLELAWAPCGAQDAGRWELAVKDTGPGIGHPRSSELRDALEVASKYERRVARDTLRDEVTHIQDPHAGLPAPGATDGDRSHGEGIGLSIVKRLCELLDATVQVDSTPSGTTFCIVFPRAYGG